MTTLFHRNRHVLASSIYSLLLLSSGLADASTLRLKQDDVIGGGMDSIDSVPGHDATATRDGTGPGGMTWDDTGPDDGCDVIIP